MLEKRRNRMYPPRRWEKNARHAGVVGRNDAHREKMRLGGPNIWSVARKRIKSTKRDQKVNMRKED